MTAKRRAIYVRRGGGMSEPGPGMIANWLKSALTVLVGVASLGYCAQDRIQKDIDLSIGGSIGKAKDELKKEMPSKIEMGLLKESVDRNGSQMQLDLASFRQALREHGEAIAQIQAEQRIRAERR